ncbi:MAG: CbiQ family ECF transporter T component [Ezakiella coagulans]|uniref:CbiQ family ECF transporter T component n=1 Tax=Ezakiella coagulans TaxID=46507 RepID=UPI00288AAA90|nr:CbiQ family ECF transporter T component [Ezakiella coagulans]
MNTIDSLATNNRLTKTNPVLKAGLGIFFLALAFFIDRWEIHLAIVILTLIVVRFVAKINLKKFIKLYKIPAAFIVLGVISILIGFGYNTENYTHYIKIGNIYAGFQKSMINDAKLILSRSLAAISATFFISVTTPITQLAQVLKKMHVPQEFIEQMILMYRFIQIFSIELEAMHSAGELKHGFESPKTWLRSISEITKMLFFRVMRSYTDFKNALDLKLFDGNFYF